MHSRIRLQWTVTIFLALALLACVERPQEQPATPSASAVDTVTSLDSSVSDPLVAFLQNYLRLPGEADEKDLRYFDALVDLDGDGKDEAIIYLVSREWCGSGGCTMLILTTEASSYKLVTKVTITHEPIRVLSRSSHGWRSISVWVQGGGIQPGYEAELEFDGNTYPSNPSVLPARRLDEEVPGEIVIPYRPVSDAKQLYTAP